MTNNRMLGCVVFLVLFAGLTTLVYGILTGDLWRLLMSATSSPLLMSIVISGCLSLALLLALGVRAKTK